MKKITALITILILSSAITSVSLASESKKHKMGYQKMPMEMSKEQRQEMAAHHEKLALCLRSDRAMADCHKEMRSACEGKMGMGGCWMMGDTRKMDSKSEQSNKVSE